MFLVASDMARIVSSTTLVFVAWIVGGFIVLCGAFCYADWARRFPRPAGLYVCSESRARAAVGISFRLDELVSKWPVAMATLVQAFSLRSILYFRRGHPAVSADTQGALLICSYAASRWPAVVVLLVTAVDLF